MHERKIEIRTYPLPDDRLLVEGRLKDDRLVKVFHRNGKEREPGVVHWMIARLLIGDWPITILDAEAEMPATPHPRCAEIAEAVRQVVGLPIAAGYSARVLRRLGGIRGCAHLTHLLLAMGPAALHGYWSQRGRRPRPLPRSPEEMPELKVLVNSCHLWTEDGPILKEIRADMALQAQGSEVNKKRG